MFLIRYIDARRGDDYDGYYLGGGCDGGVMVVKSLVEVVRICWWCWCDGCFEIMVVVVVVEVVLVNVVVMVTALKFDGVITAFRVVW